mmetsp:Transcript_2831/g.7721  ORF Transcript_2831/g.7721 Transcript_2831/m.7721 type:complete len:224 (+) Transcript_2831:1066-1737(+)
MGKKGWERGWRTECTASWFGPQAKKTLIATRSSIVHEGLSEPPSGVKQHSSLGLPNTRTTHLLREVLEAFRCAQIGPPLEESLLRASITSTLLTLNIFAPPTLPHGEAVVITCDPLLNIPIATSTTAVARKSCFLSLVARVEKLTGHTEQPLPQGKPWVTTSISPPSNSPTPSTNSPRRRSCSALMCGAFVAPRLSAAAPTPRRWRRRRRQRPCTWVRPRLPF